MKKPYRFVVTLQAVVIAILFALGLASVFNHNDTAFAAARTCNDGPSVNGPAGFSLLPSLFSQTPDVCVGDMPSSNMYFFQIQVKLPYDPDGATLAAQATVTVTSPYGGGITIPMTSIGTATFVSTKAFVIPMTTAAGGCNPASNYLVNVKISVPGVADTTEPNIDLCSTNRSPSGSDPATFTYTLTKEIAALNPRASGNPATSKQHIVGFIGADFGSALTTDPLSQYHALEKNGVQQLTLTKSDGTVVFSCTNDCSTKDGLRLSGGAFAINTSDNPTIGLGTYDLTFNYSARGAGVQNAPDEWAPHTFKFTGIIVKTAGQDVDITPGASVESLQYYDSGNNKTSVGANPTAEKLSAQCAGGALGWFLCPFMKIFEAMNNFMAPQIENQLKIDPLVDGNSIYAGTFPIWQVIVGIANLVLVVAFLIVIFSQATSIGLSAYGIKKMLPRIIAAAILINLSYFICRLAVDVVNVIGGSVQGIINIGGSALNVQGGFSTNFGQWLGELGGLVLGGVAIALSGAVAYLVPLALTGVLATMVIFLGLALRKIMIVLLIIVAPLAFAAMILPGTEGLFKKWYKALGGLFIMYPVVMAILYGSVLLSNIILAQDSNVTISSSGATFGEGGTIGSSSESTTTTVNVSNDSIVTIILAYAIVAIGPFAGTYMFIKNSNKLFSAAAGAINKMGSPFKKLADQYAGDKVKNSKASTLMNVRRKNAEEYAQREAYLAMSRRDKDGKPKGMWARAAMAGTRGHERSALEAQLYGAEGKIYDQDVGYALAEYKRRFDSKEAMQEHFMTELSAGRMDAARTKAALDYIGSFSGGGTMIDNMVMGTDAKYGNQFWEGLRKHYTGGQQDAWKGASRSLAGGAYAEGSPDAAGFIAHHGDAALFTAAETEGGVSRIQEFTGEGNWERGQERSLTVDTSGKRQTVKVNQGVDEATQDYNMGYDYVAKRLSTKAPSLGKRQAKGLEAAIKAGLEHEDAGERATMINSVLAVSDQTLSSIKDPLIKDIVIAAQEKARAVQAADRQAASGGGNTGSGPSTTTATAPGGQQFEQSDSGLFVPRERG